MDILKELYAIHAPSGREKRMRKYLFNNLRGVPGAVVECDNVGNVYARRGEAENYPCIVAHIDQVQDIHSPDFCAVETDDIIFGYSPVNRQFEGLGADDKNGVWCALKLFTDPTIKNIKIAFFVGEEIGCVGSSSCRMTFFDDAAYILQADRRGYGDLITRIGWQSLCSQEFVDKIEPERYGYKTTSGAMTDVEELRNRGVSVCCCNISCGYYDPHTDNEYTIKSDLLNCLSFMRHIIEVCGEDRQEFAGDDGGGRDDWYNWKYPTSQKKHNGNTPSSQKFYDGCTPSNQKDFDDLEHEMELDEAAYELVCMAKQYPNTTYDEAYDIIMSYYPELTGEEFDALYFDAFRQEEEEYNI